MTQAYIRIQSANGVFDFSQYDMPLIHRRMTHRSAGAQDGIPAATIITVSLSGFFDGDNHSEVSAKYQTLLNVIKAPEVKLTYYDGAQFVIDDQICFVGDYDEPSSWKQYGGDYNISLNYTQELNHSSYMNIAASYSSPAGWMIFQTTPIWALKADRSNTEIGYSERTPGGNLLGSKMQITLTGELAGQNHQDLSVKMMVMNNAFSRDGVLNYGVWSDNVKVLSSPSFGPTLPYYTCQYSVTLGYTTRALIDFKSSRTYTRINFMPDIRKRKFCPTDFVRLNRPSGQEVTYSFSAKSTNVSYGRMLLRAEIWNAIIPGGIEMEGGTENQDDMTNEVSLTIKKYYLTPVLLNIED